MISLVAVSMKTSFGAPKVSFRGHDSWAGSFGALKVSFRGHDSWSRMTQTARHITTE